MDFSHRHLIEYLQAVELWHCVYCLRLLCGEAYHIEVIGIPVRTHAQCWDKRDGGRHEPFHIGNFWEVFLRAFQLLCSICENRGATMSCVACQESFHWTCRNDQAEFEDHVRWCRECFEQTSTIRCL